MSNNKNQGDEDCFDRALSVDLSATPGLVFDEALDLSKVQDSLRAVNDYAAGLSIALPKDGSLGKYANVIESQVDVLDSVLEVSERFKIDNDQIVSLMDSTVLPLSSAVAEVGLVGANATRLYGLGSIDSEQLQLSQELSGLALGALEEQQSSINSSFAAIKSSGVLKLADEIVPALSTISCGISEIMRSLPTYPIGTEAILPDLQIIREAVRNDEKEPLEHQDKLDELLNEIDSSLVEFRTGAWDAFDGKGDDYIGQASSSMRRLADTLLRIVAPPEKVVKTNYFKTSLNAQDKNGKPTREARVHFVANWDQDRSKHLKRSIEGFLKIYDNLFAWDHVPLREDDFVHGVFIMIEGSLLSLLSQNKK